MLKFERPKYLDPEMFDKFVEFIEVFIDKSHEDMTVKDVITHISSCNPNESGVWFIYEDEILKGYLFAEVVKNHEGICTIIHHLCISGIKDRNIFTKVVNLLKEFGAPLGSKEIIFSTDHDPKAFIRLIKNGFQVESHILSLTY